MNQAHLDAVARQRGFPDYATWAAWNAHRQAGLQASGSPPPQQNNFLQSLISRIPFHPANILEYVNRKINGEQP